MVRFLSAKAHKRPSVTLAAAMTLDGKIATRSGDSSISSPSDLEKIHRLRSRTDAVMIGRGTQLSDNPQLTVRRISGRNPVRIVVDSLARTSPKSKILSKGGGMTIIAVSKRAPETRVERLRSKGAKIIRCGSQRVDLRKLLMILRKLGVSDLLLEGGGKLNWSMLTEKLVDEIQITISPRVVGGEKAKTLVEGIGVGNMNHAIMLSLLKVTRSGNELVLRYKVRN